MDQRSNKDWLNALRNPQSEEGQRALRDLREYLLRACSMYLSQHRRVLEAWSLHDIRNLAENLSQEAVVEIQDKLGTFRGDSKFTTWAYRFIIHRAASELRLRRYSDLSLDRLLEEEPDVFRPLFTGQQAPPPERFAARRAYLELLHTLITEELNERQRAAIVGVYLQGYSMEEVAKALEVNRNALYKLLHDARQRIKQALEAKNLTLGDILATFED